MSCQVVNADDQRDYDYSQPYERAAEINYGLTDDDAPARDVHADMPAFHYTPAAERAAAIAPPPPPTATERAEQRAREAEDRPESRMSIAQLADRIQGMEATTAKYGDPTTGHHYSEKPGARIQRAEKLTRYRAEHARRVEASRISDEAARAENMRIAAAEDAAATVTEIPPPPADAAAATEAASTRRRAVVAECRAVTQAEQPPPAADGLTELDRTIEALVRLHTCGDVIDAAWSASARLFKPQQAKR